MYKLFKILLLLIPMSLIFCNKNRKEKKEDNILSLVVNDCNHKKVFGEYLESLKSRDVDKIIKTFPKDNISEIWKVISFYTEDEKILKESFEKSDLINEFERIFSNEFLLCLSEIDLDTLFNKGEVISKDYQISKEEICRVISTYDKVKNKLVFVLSYEFYEDGDKYESSINYSYLFENCKLKMAGLILVN